MRSFLSDCKRIEETASKLYQRLADEKSYVNEVRLVFKKLSDDEMAHARNIDLALQANDRELVATQMIPEPMLKDAVIHVELLLRKVEREEKDEAKALRLAAYMEQEFAKVHVQNALSFSNHKLAELFDKLSKEDEQHLKTLKDCLEWWNAERKQNLTDN